jgi:putative ubiquitin-RnfH superfamily antitoxin RatB of RatAB toxin-antitoxin module
MAARGDLASPKRKQLWQESVHESADADTANQLDVLYNQTIDFGAHPNQMGVLATIRHAEDADKIEFNVGILAPSPKGVMATLRIVAAVAIGVFKVFQLIYPERFVIMGFLDEIDALVASLNTIFKRFGAGGSA